MASKKSIARKIYEYWQRRFESHRLKMSHGAQNIFKIITWGKGEKWRRTQKKNEKKFQNKKK